MKTFIFLESFTSIVEEHFIEQLILYHSLSEVWLIDNTQSPDMRNHFLQKTEGLPLERVNYMINENRLTFGMCANKFLADSSENILLVLPYVHLTRADIQEMERILTMSEHHAFVVPRTNRGHFQTIPVHPYLLGRECKAEKEMVCRKMAELLPDYALLPWAEDGCVMMDAARLFDISGFQENYNTMSMAVRDFSILMANYGYNTVMANHSFAENVMEIAEQDVVSADEEYLQKRLKEPMQRLLDKYYGVYLRPEDYFLDVAAGKCNGKKLLYFIPHLDACYNGSAVHALNLLDGLIDHLPKQWELTVAASGEARKFFALDQKYTVRILELHELDDLYDVVFAPYNIYGKQQLEAIKKHAYRFITWPLDAIMDRSNYLSETIHLQYHEIVAQICDGMIFSAEATKKDYEMFYYDMDNLKQIPKLVCPIVPERFTESEKEPALPFEDYYLIFGNSFLHKMISHTKNVIQNSKENFIIVGDTQEGFIAPHIYAFQSGRLSDTFLAGLYDNCRALIFPSIYEGFGLPILQALNAGKNVYLMDTELNHELEKLSPAFKGHLFYLRSLYDLNEIMQQTRKLEGPEKNSYRRTWSDAGRECMDFIRRVMEEEIHPEKLLQRFRQISPEE